MMQHLVSSLLALWPKYGLKKLGADPRIDGYIKQYIQKDLKKEQHEQESSLKLNLNFGKQPFHMPIPEPSWMTPTLSA